MKQEADNTLALKKLNSIFQWQVEVSFGESQETSRGMPLENTLWFAEAHCLKLDAQLWCTPNKGKAHT